MSALTYARAGVPDSRVVHTVMSSRTGREARVCKSAIQYWFVTQQQAVTLPGGRPGRPRARMGNQP